MPGYGGGGDEEGLSAELRLGRGTGRKGLRVKRGEDCSEPLKLGHHNNTSEM